MAKSYNVNSQITAKFINLVLSDGLMEEEIPLRRALAIAEEEGLDVVEVSEKGKGGLPVCKVMDYGRMKYQQDKKKKGGKKIQHTKEIKYGINIDIHDLNVKHKKILKFLSKKYMVRYILELNGRERARIDEAVEKMNVNLEEFREVGSWKEPQVSKGRRISILTIISPL